MNLQIKTKRGKKREDLKDLKKKRKQKLLIVKDTDKTSEPMPASFYILNKPNSLK